MRSLLLSIAGLLVACGGGSSSGGGQRNDPAPPPPPPPPVTTSFSVAGSVSVSSNQALDSDTNDPGNPHIPNDSLGSAQRINNPTTLGGYVNLPGSGASGRSQAGGDVDDFFRVELLAGQTVTMLVADFATADADLYLYDDSDTIVDFSVETGEVESLVVPADGRYRVNARAFEGATNYILAIGNPQSTSQASRQHYIQPREAVVRFPGTDGLPPWAGALQLEHRGGGPGRPHLLALPGGDAHLRARRLGSAAARYEDFSDPDLQARFETLITIKTLGRTAEVSLAEPNYRVRSFLQPDDEALPFQWHLPLIDLPAAWDSSVGDPAVTVAVIDSGILSRHPDLGSQLVSGYDFVSSPSRAGDGDGIDPDPEDPGALRGAGPGSYHGSHVAGTVAAAGNNGVGVAGVAYGARLMPLRALDGDGSGTSYDINQAIRFAAGLANDSGEVPPRPADVINLSLGGAPFSQAQQRLLDEVRARGSVVVAAAGNDASTVPQYPAAYEGVLSVGAVDIRRQLAPYSNRGPSIDLVAPGGNNGVDFNGDGYPDGVLSTGAVGTVEPEFAYTFISGTSMAAPHVAGVIALMRSVNPSLTPDDIELLLGSGHLSDDLGTPGRDDTYGHGLVNAYKAVLAALETLGTGTANTPRLAASASTLSFGGSEQSLPLELSNAGGGELTLSAVTTDAPWLAVQPRQVDAAGLGRYAVTIQRQGLAEGVYAATITVLSSANALTVRVLMSVGEAGGEADVGTVYVLLIDPASDETVGEVAVRPQAGRYRFRFPNVPEGEYQLVAGSDADNDQFVCDSGEACGAWLTLDQPGTLVLDSDLDQLNFPVEYQVFIPEAAAASLWQGRALQRADAWPGRTGARPRPQTRRGR